MKCQLSLALAAALGAYAAPTSKAASRGTSDVVVDLGYTLHVGQYHSPQNVTAFYSFTNIQYASANRFEPPGPPAETNNNPNNPNYGYSETQCPQAAPNWFGPSLAAANGQTPPAWTNTTYSETSYPPGIVKEDCLFLDMVVPTDVYNKKKPAAAVIVNIHGGGYTTGDKNADNPSGRAYQPTAWEGEGLISVNDTIAGSRFNTIYISINYRLGLFGWLAGSSYTSNAKTNLGLLDQRAALEWVQQYISAFNGDASQVTIIGESAGGGSVMHQAVAYAGKQGTPFARIVPQSPWHQPITHQKQEEMYQYVLQTANVTTFEELKALDYGTLYRVNQLVVSNAYPFGLFNFGPVVDGDIVPDYYNNLLNHKDFNQSLITLTGHNSDEGAIFADPFIKTDADYLAWLQSIFTNASPAAISNITDNLYPAVFDGSQGYTDQYGRVSKTIGDFSAVCNAELITNDVYGYAYLFSYPPGFHGADIPYTQYIPGASQGVNVTMANRFQADIVAFAQHSAPATRYNDYWPTSISSGGHLEGNFANSSVTVIPVDNFNKRCDFWSAGLYR